MRNISSSVNSRLELDIEHDKKYVFSSEQAIKRFVTNTDFSGYTHVLCMGRYGGRDQDKLRLETVCSSKFRRTDPINERLEITPFIEPNDKTKLASAIGNSWCNLLSYSLLKEIDGRCEFTFVHIPKKMRIEKAAGILKQSINKSLD